MTDYTRVYSGRKFSDEDIKMIKWARRQYSGLSRSELAGTVCEILGWTTPAGQPKLQQCKSFLEILEEEGEIELPKAKAKSSGKIKPIIPDYKFDTKEISGDLKEFEPISLVIATPGKELKRWRAYVDQFHMLKDKQVFGSRLHYFVKSGERELGCIQFSAAAWSLENRDDLIGWSMDDRKARLHLILNNSRYLILPWVNIKNLASKALSMAVKRIQRDWLEIYCYEPVMLETFVDSQHFSGICYKAGNWKYIGETKGSGRNSTKKGTLSPKLIFVYPLQVDFKEVLRGEKPYKVKDPDIDIL